MSVLDQAGIDAAMDFFRTEGAEVRDVKLSPAIDWHAVGYLIMITEAFTRIAGPVLGTIANEIEGAGDDLALRFSFALVVLGVAGGSSAERDYAESMTGDYLKAVAATLGAMRRLATEPAVPA